MKGIFLKKYAAIFRLETKKFQNYSTYFANCTWILSMYYQILLKKKICSAYGLIEIKSYKIMNNKKLIDLEAQTLDLRPSFIWS